MAMTKGLWSLNALSVELGRDRRTIAAALSDVPPDGTRQGDPAWFLSTALRALDPKPQPGGRTVGDGACDGPLWHFAGRLEDWEEIHSRQPLTGTVKEIAVVFQVTVDAVLVWLRAGMPYVTRGDWHT